MALHKRGSEAMTRKTKSKHARQRRYWIQDYLVLALLISGFCYSTYRELQALAIVMIGLIVAIAYKPHTSRLVGTAFGLLRQTSQAKFGQLEFKVGDRESYRITGEHPVWMQIILSELSPEHVGLLLLVHETEAFEVHGGNRDTLRHLRSHGLVAHDGGSLTLAGLAWTTPLGDELCEVLDSAGVTVNDESNVEINS